MVNFRGRMPKVFWWVILALIVTGLVYFTFRGWKEGLVEDPAQVVTPTPPEGGTPPSAEVVTPTPPAEVVPLTPPEVVTQPPPEVVPAQVVTQPPATRGRRPPRRSCPERDPDNTVQARCNGSCNLSGHGMLSDEQRIVCSDTYCIGCGEITNEQRREVAARAARNATP
jgi:hypothetical protein